jgi:hypothetical protein
MANNFIKVEIQGVSVLINKSHIVLANFGNTAVAKLTLTTGVVMEVRHTTELFGEIQS